MDQGRITTLDVKAALNSIEKSRCDKIDTDTVGVERAKKLG